MPRIIHPLAGLVALLTIATFWVSTVLSELFGSEATVTAVKTTIPWGFLLLVPALAATGGSGLFLSKGQRTGLVGAKLRRMPIIALNGLLVLIPAALFLASKARAGAFDASFYTAQGVELIAGAVNLTLLGLGMRDGLALSRWRRGSFLRPAATHATRLAAREELADGTMVIRLDKPEGFRFQPGQAVYLSVPDPLEKPDGRGKVRVFSIASAPRDPMLEIVTRQTGSSFKRTLAAAEIGAPLRIEGPYGDLALRGDTERPAVFLAGGIGITPFLSMLRDAARQGLSRRMVLFYGNRTPESAAFLPELRALERRDPRFTLITTFTEGVADPRAGATEQGRISAAMLSKYLDDPATAVFQIVPHLVV
ncbi:ferredoxin--NADP reductase [Amaricoccus sp. W119]|uniref:ferredoxin--NADP reductase n=1 Tax=Amaricoccus sp. W119 TaxID=3391833 RepID=UPI0039A56948